MKSFLAVASLGMSVLLGAVESHAQLLNIPNPDEVCRNAPATFRKTIIYVDVSSIRDKETEWGLTLLNKLELGPRESITLLGVNPSTYEIIDVFDSCYPTATSEELKILRENRGFWDNLTKMDPESQQKENIQTFETRLKGALNRLVDESKKAKAGGRRNILGAISVDKNRFRDSAAYYRVIIYTDGNILDPQIADVTGEAAQRALAEKYPAVFSGAEAYVYGVTGKDKDRPLEIKEKSFDAFFLSNWAWLRSFAPSLPQQTNDRFPAQVVMNGTFDGGGTQGALKLSATIQKEKANTLAWLTFTVAGKSLFVPFQTEVKCSEEDCVLDGTALEDVPAGSSAPYFKKSDVLHLSGKGRASFEGTIKPASREVFKGGPEVQYKLKLSKN